MKLNMGREARANLDAASNAYVCFELAGPCGGGWQCLPDMWRHPFLPVLACGWPGRNKVISVRWHPRRCFVI